MVARYKALQRSLYAIRISRAFDGSNREKTMNRILIGLLFAGSLLLPSSGFSASADAPDGMIKITSRMVASGIGLSWGEGVLSYKGRNYPFTFKATGLFRDVDTAMTAAELSGEVFHLKRP